MQTRTYCQIKRGWPRKPRACRLAAENAGSQGAAVDTRKLAEHLTAALSALKPDDGPAFADVLARYETEHLPSLAVNTREQYAVWSRMLRLSDLPDMRLGEIAPSDVLAAARMSSGAAGQSALARYVSRVYQWAHRVGVWSGVDPAANLPQYVSPIPHNALDEDELRALFGALMLDHIGALWSRRCVAFLGLTPWRPSEALDLYIEQVRRTRNGIWAALKHTKTGPSQRAISEHAYVIVERAADGRLRGLVFRPARITVKRGRAILNEVLTRACKEAGLRRRKMQHLRHTGATLVHAHGAALPDVAALLGHKNTKSTLRYLHGDRRRQRNAIDKLGNALTAPSGKGDSNG